MLSVFCGESQSTQLLNHATPPGLKSERPSFLGSGILLSVWEQPLEPRQHIERRTAPYKLLLPLRLGHSILKDGMEVKLVQNLPQNGDALWFRDSKRIARVTEVPKILATQ